MKLCKPLAAAALAAALLSTAASAKETPKPNAQATDTYCKISAVMAHDGYSQRVQGAKQADAKTAVLEKWQPLTQNDEMKRFLDISADAVLDAVYAPKLPDSLAKADKNTQEDMSKVVGATLYQTCLEKFNEK